MWKVIADFCDSSDGHVYHEGDTFPREGVEVSEARMTELSTFSNRRSTPLIEKVRFERPKKKKK